MLVHGLALANVDQGVVLGMNDEPAGGIHALARGVIEHGEIGELGGAAEGVSHEPLAVLREARDELVGVEDPLRHDDTLDGIEQSGRGVEGRRDGGRVEDDRGNHMRAAAVSDEVDLLQSLLDVGTGGSVPDQEPGQEEKNIVRMRRVVDIILWGRFLRCKAIVWHQNNALSTFCDPSSQVSVVAFILSAVNTTECQRRGVQRERGGGGRKLTISMPLRVQIQYTLTCDLPEQMRQNDGVGQNHTRRRSTGALSRYRRWWGR